MIREEAAGNRRGSNGDQEVEHRKRQRGSRDRGEHAAASVTFSLMRLLAAAHPGGECRAAPSPSSLAAACRGREAGKEMHSPALQKEVQDITSAANSWNCLLKPDFISLLLLLEA